MIYLSYHAARLEMEPNITKTNTCLIFDEGSSYSNFCKNELIYEPSEKKTNTGICQGNLSLLSPAFPIPPPMWAERAPTQTYDLAATVP